jgi:hypothetical protein
MQLADRHQLTEEFRMACGGNRAGAPMKYGAEILLDDLLVRLSADCPWRDDPRRDRCAARFSDMLREARDPRHRQCRALLLAEVNGPEVAHGRARTAALAKQPIKLWEERVAGGGA